MNPRTAISIAILLAVGGLVFVAVRKGQALADAINPFSNENAVAQGFNDILNLDTGRDDRSLGSIIFDLFNPEFDPNAPIKVQPGDAVQVPPKEEVFFGPPAPPG